MATISKGLIREISQNLLTLGLTPTEIRHRYGIDFPEIHELASTGQIPSFGDLELYPHIISVKPREGLWPSRHFGDVMQAKDGCDKGLVNLTYGYLPTHLVMYAIPRRVRAFRKPWFYGEIGNES